MPSLTIDAKCESHFNKAKSKTGQTEGKENGFKHKETGEGILKDNFNYWFSPSLSFFPFSNVT